MIREIGNNTVSPDPVEHPVTRNAENSRSLDGNVARLPDDSGERRYRLELPDDSGERRYRLELPDDSGEATNYRNSLRSSLVREKESFTGKEDSEDLGESLEKKEPIQNKKDGLERERTVEQELRETYPEENGFQVLQETYLRNRDGQMVYDPVTGERRRIDFVVVKDNKVVDSVEVTSLTAPKDAQAEKENRIREAGGNYVKDKQGNLMGIPKTVHTRIERRA